MNIINYKYITFHKEFDEPKEDYNIISCTLFRMKDGYKNELKYYDGLKLFIENFQKFLPNFYFRLYYDDSVLDYETPTKIENTKKYWQPLFDKMKLNKKIQLIKYEMKDFKIDKLHHNGVIGTMTRFFPSFDDKNNDKIKCVFITDIDINMYVLKMLKLNLDKMNKGKVDFFYLTRNCYELQDRFQILTKQFNIKFPILAGTIISKIKFPLIMLDKFFHCILNIEDKDCEYYKMFHTLQMPEWYQRKDNKIEIRYGVDELFTLILKDYLYKNKIKHMISFDSDVAKPFFIILTNYQEKKITDAQFKNSILPILLDLYDDNKSPEENYKQIDDIVYYKKTINNVNKYVLFDRLLHLVNKIKNNELDNKDYGFTEDQINCTLNTVLEKKFFVIEYVNNFDDNIKRIEV
jgi:hypothetical protein